MLTAQLSASGLKLLAQLRRQEPRCGEGAVPLRPAWPHPALPALAGVEPAPGAAWACPPPASPRRFPHGQRPRLGHAQTLGWVPGRGHARRRSDWATGEKAAPPRGRSRQGAEPRVRPPAACRELSVPSARG